MSTVMGSTNSDVPIPKTPQEPGRQQQLEQQRNYSRIKVESFQKRSLVRLVFQDLLRDGQELPAVKGSSQEKKYRLQRRLPVNM